MLRPVKATAQGGKPCAEASGERLVGQNSRFSCARSKAPPQGGAALSSPSEAGVLTASPWPAALDGSRQMLPWAKRQAAPPARRPGLPRGAAGRWELSLPCPRATSLLPQ